jgi:hypothetical protein
MVNCRKCMIDRSFNKLDYCVIWMSIKFLTLSIRREWWNWIIQEFTHDGCFKNWGIVFFYLDQDSGHSSFYPCVQCRPEGQPVHRLHLISEWKFALLAIHLVYILQYFWNFPYEWWMGFVLIERWISPYKIFSVVRVKYLPLKC